MTNNLPLTSHNKNTSSFTLIELLVVLALVATLSVVVVLTLNPAELIKQARDSNRLSDLATINTALNLFSTDVTSGFMGTSTVVYVSIPSASSTCSNLGLPALPVGYTYNCVTSQNLRNIDGTGWIPVNFQRISSNSPISQLPIDPINTTTTRLYYTYIPGGSWELNASIEASKNKLGGSNDLMSKDGGNAPSTYELGNNLSLNPIEAGDVDLIRYWNFNEGAGSSVKDYSGYNGGGTWVGTLGNQWVAGKYGTAGNFDGSTNYISIGGMGCGTSPLFSISVWVRPTAWSVDGRDVIMGGSFNQWQYFSVSANSIIHNTYNGTNFQNLASRTINLNEWINIVTTYNYSANYSAIYLNGVLVSTRTTGLLGNLSGSSCIGAIGSHTQTGTNAMFTGQIDEIRVYRKSLSPAEVSALYDSTK